MAGSAACLLQQEGCKGMCPVPVLSVFASLPAKCLPATAPVTPSRHTRPILVLSPKCVGEQAGSMQEGKAFRRGYTEEAGR